MGKFLEINRNYLKIFHFFEFYSELRTNSIFDISYRRLNYRIILKTLHTFMIYEKLMSDGVVKKSFQSKWIKINLNLFL